MERFDFSRPGRLPGEAGQRLAAWLRAASALAPQYWRKALPFEAGVSLRRADVLPTAEALASLPEQAVAHRVGVRGQSMLTLLALPRPLVLALVGGLLGEAGAAPPEDRAPTPVEESLWQDFLRQGWLTALAEAWPGNEPLTAELLQGEPHPRFTRVFAGEDRVVVCSLTWRGPFGEQEASWLLPLGGLLEQLGGQRPAAAEGPATAERLAGLVRELPVEITVVLGTARVPVPALSRLRVGDVVLLDQRLSEPLPALVGGERKFLGWPGRAGGWQAFQIESRTDG